MKEQQDITKIQEMTTLITDQAGLLEVKACTAV
jgi:hypothetical protein